MGAKPARACARVPISLAIAAGSACGSRAAPIEDWRVTGGDPGNGHYSSLAQIDRSNVAKLEVAWTYRTGDLIDGARTEMQATPIVVNGVMFATTPALSVIALRASSGTLLWKFDPFAGRDRKIQVNRGVAYWTDGDARRVFFTAGRRLYSLDASTGLPAAGFGDSGWVDLAVGLNRNVDGRWLIATSPGVIYRDLLIQGSRVGEAEGSAPGHVRAYDVRTGKVRWTFHTIPQPHEFGYDTWPAGAWKTAGGANSWPGMAVDKDRGIVFVPTGSATPDFYGGARIGQNLFANTLLALDAATGKRVWHFQTVHHDLWDRDLPAAPNLLQLTRDGRRVDAVAQITKSGYVFLFDREHGTPLFPIEERPVPASDLRGEQTWPTQPMPTKPRPFARQSVADSDITDRTPAAHDAALARFHALRQGGFFTPPSKEGSIVLPGFDGGGEWGGAAIDRATGVLFVNASDVPWIAAMREASAVPRATRVRDRGAIVYSATCAPCHSPDRGGDGGRAPTLVGIGARLSATEIRQVIERGRGFMPSFAELPEVEKAAIVSYLLGRKGTLAASAGARDSETGTPRGGSAKSQYEFVGYERWRDADGYPAIKPPWGTLSAIDMNTGEYRWRIPLGSHPELEGPEMPPTGTENYGGPIVTAGGLVFIAATSDAKIRAFDKDTGRQLWEAPLPAAGYATPSTYMVAGRQYVVIAAGGGKLGTPSGDTYVAFALNAAASRRSR